MCVLCNCVHKFMDFFPSNPLETWYFPFREHKFAEIISKKYIFYFYFKFKNQNFVCIIGRSCHRTVASHTICSFSGNIPPSIIKLCQQILYTIPTSVTQLVSHTHGNKKYEKCYSFVFLRLINPAISRLYAHS